MDPAGRMTCEELLDHSYFDTFRDWFHPELEVYIHIVYSLSEIMCIHAGPDWEACM